MHWQVDDLAYYNLKTKKTMKRYKHYIFDWGDTLMVDFPLENGPMYQWSNVEAIFGAKTLLHTLSKSAECYIATNAKDSTESDIRKALARVGLDPYIKNIFCYQNIGFEKPSKAFFQKIYASLNTEKNEIVLVGDSLDKDVRGALDFGFDAIWFNIKKKTVPKGINSVNHLMQIIDLQPVVPGGR